LLTRAHGSTACATALPARPPSLPPTARYAGLCVSALPRRYATSVAPARHHLTTAYATTASLRLPAYTARCRGGVRSKRHCILQRNTAARRSPRRHGTTHAAPPSPAPLPAADTAWRSIFCCALAPRQHAALSCSTFHDNACHYACLLPLPFPLPPASSLHTTPAYTTSRAYLTPPAPPAHTLPLHLPSAGGFLLLRLALCGSCASSSGQTERTRAATFCMR